MSALLDIRNLSVQFTARNGVVDAVSNVDLQIVAGECLGVVGESGSGKSQLFLSILGLLAANGRVTGSARFAGEELIGRTQQQLNHVRGSKIAMVFQDPMTSLTPHLTIGVQIAETLIFHKHLSRRAALRRAAELLERVHVTDPPRRLKQYPHELSGGMRQRVTIAMALACEPALIIADEPTTALDVTIQAQLLELFAELKDASNTALALITHDLGVVAGLADRVVVMRKGQIVEHASVDELFQRPQHEYTRHLLDATPRLDDARAAAVLPSPFGRGVGGEGNGFRGEGNAENLLSVEQLRVAFSTMIAVRDISLKLAGGETLSVVGESGCGKSTLARAILQLTPATAGNVSLSGQSLPALSPGQLREQRRQMQVVFQDPLASLNPRMTVLELIAEPLVIFHPQLSQAQRAERVRQTLSQVGLGAELISRYPHELSGGQCQRVGIARAIILNPKLLVCDEAVSALDVCVQQQIVTLLLRLQRELNLALLFISHNLAVVRQISHNVLVLYLGRVMECASRDELFERPLHPYTRALITAAPIPDPVLARRQNRAPICGELPSALHPPSGCVFRTRCPWATNLCAETIPPLDEVAPNHAVACHHWKRLHSPHLSMDSPS